MGRYDLPDHPVIRNMERYGSPDGLEYEEELICPACKHRAAYLYWSTPEQDYIGCNICIEERWCLRE